MPLIVMDVDTCICARLRRATRSITKLYDDALKGGGVNATQFTQLYAIATIESPTLVQLSYETCLDRSTLGRNIRVLVKMGLVSMDSGSDERTKVVHLTSKGVTVFEESKPLWVSAQRQVAGVLGEIGRQHLFELLNSVEGIK